VVSLLTLHHKRPRGLNRNLEVVHHHVLQNKKERRKIGDVVGFLTRRIVLIHLDLPLAIPILANLMLIARFMVMTLTISLHCILNFDKFSPKKIMWGNPKVFERLLMGFSTPIKVILLLNFLATSF